MKYLVLVLLLFFVSAATCEKKVEAEEQETSKVEEVPYMDTGQTSSYVGDVESDTEEAPVGENDESESGSDDSGSGADQPEYEPESGTDAEPEE